MAKRLGPILDGTAAVAMIVASVVVVWWALTASRRPPGPPSPNRASTVEEIKALETFDRRVGAAELGRPDAKWAIVEFSDFECPFCGRYARESFPQLRRDFVDNGKIRYILVNYPLEKIHPLALPAAKAASCAGEHGKYWEMHDRLFLDPPKLQTADLQEYASAVGLDPGGFADCLDHASDTAIRAGQQMGQRLGVKATPTFFLGRVNTDGSVALTRKWSGARPYAGVKPLLEQALRQ